MLDPAGVGVTTQPLMISWTPKDCALYALGVGAGVNDLAFTTDNTEGVPPQMLPTMPAILGLDLVSTSRSGRSTGSRWSTPSRA